MRWAAYVLALATIGMQGVILVHRGIVGTDAYYLIADTVLYGLFLSLGNLLKKEQK